jgi:hypothetical protein
VPVKRKDGKWSYDSGWATVTFKGKTRQIIPSRTLIRGLSAALSGLANGDPMEILAAAQNYGYSRTTPGLQAPLTLGLGWGYDPSERQFTAGGLSMEERLKGGLGRGLPILAQSAIDDPDILRDPAALTEEFLGSSPMTAFRPNAQKAVDEADGDYRAAYDIAIMEGDEELAQSVRSLWRDDFESRGKEFGLTVIPGSFDEESGIGRAPLIEIERIEKIWREDGGEGWQAFVQQELADGWNFPGPGSQKIKAIANGIGPKGSPKAMREAFIKLAAPEYAKMYGVTLDIARDQLTDDFNALPEMKNYEKAKKYERLQFWREHPDLLHEAWLLGIEDDNADERKILEDAGYAQ